MVLKSQFKKLFAKVNPNYRYLSYILNNLTDISKQFNDRIKTLVDQQQELSNLYIDNLSKLEKQHKQILADVQSCCRNSENLHNYGRLQGVMSKGSDSYKSYVLSHNMPEILTKMRAGFDQQSNDLLDNLLLRIMHWPDVNDKFDTLVNSKQLQSWILPAEIMIKRQYEQEKCEYLEKYDLLGMWHNPDVFTCHHGLRSTSNKLKAYIKSKDFIDGGAYIGDSVLALREYGFHKSYSFEISRRNCELYRLVMQANNVSVNKYELINKGLFSYSTSINMNDRAGQGANLMEYGSSEVKTVALDDIVKEKSAKPGFIKYDLEGACLDGVKGMRQTLIDFRPVLSLAIYHSPIEFFEVKPLLDDYLSNLDYRIELKLFSSSIDLFADVFLFAYPRELGD